MKLRSITIVFAAVASLIAPSTIFAANNGKSAYVVPNHPISYKCPALKQGDDPMDFEAKAGPVTDKTYTLVLRASSCTDSPLPGVTVAISHCGEGQQLPFRLVGRTRHLGADESLSTPDYGKTILWRAMSVPAVTSKPLELRIPLKLQVNEGADQPYCVSVTAHTNEFLGVNAPKEVKWNMK